MQRAALAVALALNPDVLLLDGKDSGLGFSNMARLIITPTSHLHCTDPISL